MKAKKDGENDQFSVGERQVFESKHREYVGLIQFCSSEGTKCFNSHLKFIRNAVQQFWFVNTETFRRNI